MTPPAATPTARRAQAPRRARRASGAAAVATRVAPPIPRRVSGPARGRTAARPRPRPQAPPLGARLVAFATTLPDRGIVDRMVRGRAWIAVVGTLLIGLVAMQVSLLKLNAGIGSDVERAAALERTNGELRAQVSQLESGERIQENAAGLGMIMPPAGQITYLRAGAAAGASAQALHDQRFNDLSKAQALPGEGDPTASQPSTGTGPDSGTATGTGTGTGSTSTSTDSTSSSSSSTDSSSSGSSSTDSSSSSSTDSSSSGTATTSTDPSSSGGSSPSSTGPGQ